MDGYINPKIDNVKIFFWLPQAIYKNVRTLFLLLLLLLLFYLFSTTRNQQHPPMHHVRWMIWRTQCVCVCVWVEKDKKRFLVGFSHPKAKLTTEPPWLA